MRALTELERHLLTVTISRELIWAGETSHNCDHAWAKAKALIERLEAIGIHGATLKRAVEKLMAEDAA